MENCADKDNLVKNGFILANHQKGIESIRTRKAWKVRESIASGVGSWLIIFTHAHTHTHT